MYQERKKIVAGSTKLQTRATSSLNSGDCSTASQSTRGSGVVDIAFLSSIGFVSIRTLPQKRGGAKPLHERSFAAAR